MKAQVPAGPPRRLLSGNYSEFFRDQLGFLEHCAKAYGDLVYIRFFHVPIYLLNSPELIESALTRGEFRKPRSVRAPLQRKVFGNGLLTSEGELWLQQRRLLQKAFERDHLANYCDTIFSITQEFLEGWKAGETKVLDDEFTDLTLRISAATFFGSSAARQRFLIKELAESLKAISERQGRIAWFADTFAPTSRRVRFNRALGNVNKLIGELIEKRRDPSGHTDLLSLLCSSCTNETQLRDEIVTFFLASHETTAITLTWLWFLLATHKDAQSKVRVESSSLNSKGDQFETITHLRYTTNAVKETLRLYPPNRSVAREVVKGFELGRYFIPTGAQIVMPQWVVHRDPRWYDSPDKFDPDRWTSEWDRDAPKYAYFPFGVGNRICIGRSFAMLGSTLISALISQKFVMTVDKRQDNVIPDPVILLRPKRKVHAILS